MREGLFVPISLLVTAQQEYKNHTEVRIVQLTDEELKKPNCVF
jgi:hypothetical protein